MLKITVYLFHVFLVLVFHIKLLTKMYQKQCNVAKPTPVQFNVKSRIASRDSSFNFTLKSFLPVLQTSGSLR